MSERALILSMILFFSHYSNHFSHLFSSAVASGNWGDVFAIFDKGKTEDPFDLLQF